MRDKKEFYNILLEIEDKLPSEYARLVGDFDFSRYVLKILQSPADTLQRPALFVVRVPQSIAGFSPHLFNTPVRRTALEDYLTRCVAAQIERLSLYDDQGLSRKRLSIALPGQTILPRTSLVVTEEYVEARIYIQWPLRERRIDQEQMKEIFFDDLPAVVNGALVACNLDEEDMEAFVNNMEDADRIRQILPTRGLVAFVGEDSLVSREGCTDLPDYEALQSLSIEESLLVSMDVPNGGSLKGLGVPTGVTLILGDAYSGRSDLLRALAAGVYNHVPTDGRERIITIPDAVYVSSESGRSVQRVDISPFFTQSPDGVDSERYGSMEADPIAAQAAATVEALEAGARALLFDESDSEPSFLSSDSRLAALKSDSTRHVVPLAQLARQLADDLGVSIIVGGFVAVTEFIEVADTILYVDQFSVHDVTKEAKAVGGISALTAASGSARVSTMIEKNRWVVPSSIDPSLGPQDQVIDVESKEALFFGRSQIGLKKVAQLADVHQTLTIGLILYYAKLRYLGEGRPVKELLDLIDRDLSSEGLECLSRDLRGDLARPRRYEIAAALNRLDTLRISHVE